MSGIMCCCYSDPVIGREITAIGLFGEGGRERVREGEGGREREGREREGGRERGRMRERERERDRERERERERDHYLYQLGFS